MAFNSIPNTWISVGKPEKQELWQRVKDNEDALNATIETARALNIPNGSFEIDSDADGVPDLWTVSYYPGGSGALDTIDAIHGAAAWKFVHPGGAGNGGGYLDSDYIPITGSSLPWLIFRLKCSIAGMKNQVALRYFTDAKVFISEEILYNSTANPTAWTQFGYEGSAPATARYVRVRLIGGYTDTDVAGSIYFDDVDLLQRNHSHDGVDSKVIPQAVASYPGTFAGWGEAAGSISPIFYIPPGMGHIDIRVTVQLGMNGGGPYLTFNGVTTNLSAGTTTTTYAVPSGMRDAFATLIVGNSQGGVDQGAYFSNMAIYAYA